MHRRIGTLAAAGVLLSACWSAAARAEQDAAAAVPDAAKAAEIARAVEPSIQADKAALYSADRGLAVDRSDAAAPRVVACVGPSWVVPSAKPAALAVVIDRGTGVVVARASEVVALPKDAVYYIDTMQLPADAIADGDEVLPSGNGLGIRLDLGGGNVAQMNVNPSVVNPAAYKRLKSTRIRFAGGNGTLIDQSQGNYQRLMAFNADHSLMASVYTQKKHAKLAERFVKILADLGDRPTETMIWPADARPWVSGVDGWAPSPRVAGELGLWNPQGKAAPSPRPGIIMPTPANTQVYVAAQVLHPYELPPAQLVGGLEGAKVLSSEPARLGQWVGSERIVSLKDVPYMAVGYGYYVPPQQRGKQIAVRARVLDLHQDVRRLIVRCQSPEGEFAKWTDDFAKVLENMKLPAVPFDPVVVPLDPAHYKPAKKDR